MTDGAEDEPEPETDEDLLVETEHGTRYRTLEIDERGEYDDEKRLPLGQRLRGAAAELDVDAVESVRALRER